MLRGSGARVLVLLAAVGLMSHGAEGLRSQGAEGLRAPRSLKIHGLSGAEGLRAVSAEELRGLKAAGAEGTEGLSAEGLSGLEARAQLIVRTFQGSAHSVAQEVKRKVGDRFINYLPHDALLLMLHPDEVATVQEMEGVEGVYSFPHHSKTKKPENHKAPNPDSLRSAEDQTIDGVSVEQPEESDEAVLDVLLAVTEEEDEEFQFTLNSWVEELEAEELGGEAIEVEQPSYHKLVVTVAKERADDVAAALAAKSLVLSVEWRPSFIFLNRWATLVTQTPDGSHHPIWDKGLRGQGEVVACADTGLDYDSCYFRDDNQAVATCQGNGAIANCINHNHRKVVTYKYWSYTNVGDANNGHGTHVVGSIAASNGNSPNNGAAPDAKIAFDDISPGGSSLRIPGDLSTQMFPHSYAAGARLHSNSWGSSTSHYTSTSREIDEFTYDHDDYLVLVANGNSGSSLGTVGSPATAKNTLSVGAGLNMQNNNPGRAQNLAGFSSRGPTFDGRIKPDVVCPGSSLTSARADTDLTSNQCTTSGKAGTSMATPICAGSAALVRQYFTQGFWASGARDDSQGYMPSGTLVKAMMVQSGQPMNGHTVLPNFHVGFGRVDLSSVLWFGAESSFKLKTFDREVVPENGSNEYCFTVESASQFKVSLVWTDKEGPTYSERALIQDLDLVVTTPQGSDLLGNGWLDGNGAAIRDDRNNVEQVTTDATTGKYRVKVLGADLPEGPQKYSLVITGNIIVASCSSVAPPTTAAPALPPSTTAAPVPNPPPSTQPPTPTPPQTTPAPPVPSPTPPKTTPAPPSPAPPTTQPPTPAPPRTTPSPPTPNPPSECETLHPAPGSPFSGKIKPDAISAEGGALSVKFNSDNSVNFNGFLAKFGPKDMPSSSCQDSGAVLTAASGHITDGAGNYNANQQCQWIIAPEGASNVAIAFDLLKMQRNRDFVVLEACTDVSCTEVFPLGMYSHKRPRDPIASNTPVMRVTMITDSSGQRGGFSATYTTSIAECQNGETVDMSARSGFILEKKGRYNKNMQCAWNITSPSNEELVLTFMEFQTESCYDTVEVDVCSSASGTRAIASSSSSGTASVRSTPTKRKSSKHGLRNGESAACAAVPYSPFSGKIKPQPIITQDEALNVRFTTDNSVHRNGFLARYGPSNLQMSSCDNSGSVITAVAGKISDGDGKYSNNQQCQWIIAPQGASNVVLLFEDFQMQRNKDFVKIEACSDVNCSSAVEIGSYSWRRPKDPIESGTPVMRVSMTTDSSKTRRGFTASYTTYASACSGIGVEMTSPSGFIYEKAGKYSKNMECSWHIKPQLQGAGQSWELNFIDFHTECAHDFVEVESCASQGGGSNRRSLNIAPVPEQSPASTGKSRSAAPEAAVSHPASGSTRAIGKVSPGKSIGKQELGESHNDAPLEGLKEKVASARAQKKQQSLFWPWSL